MIIEHNKIYNNINKKIYDNLANIEESINKYGDFKKELIGILNSNPLISFYYFKKIAYNKFLKNVYDFTLKNTLSNIYYPWKNNSKVFNWISIFDNIYALDDKLYLRDQHITLLYDEKNKNNYWHKHIIWISPIFIKILQETPHLYTDATYTFTDLV